MKWEDIKTMEPAALEAELERLAEERRNIRFQAAIGPLENPLVLRMNRRAVARIKTALSQKRLEEQKGN